MTAPLISTEALAARLADAALRVFDASFYLPTEDADARARFREAHIPGARFFDIEEIADPGTALPHMVPSQTRFARLAGALGISNESFVVFYDQKGLFSAARGWWLMRLFGHENAAVLDGGLPKWRRESRPIETGEPPTAESAAFRPEFDAARIRGLRDMRRNAETGAERVLDARPRGRFDGTAPEPRPGIAPGHIPGAVNLPVSEIMTPDGTLLPPDLLREKFHAAGVGERTRVVTSCGSGITAAILTLGLAAAGLPEGALYDGSWAEWASDPTTPKARA